MEVLSASSAVRAFVRARQSADHPGCVLVPTMGALHAGHAALVRMGAEIARERGLDAGCIVTVFVNPTQFGEQADFARYPRTLAADVEVCRAAGASVLLAPSVEDVYPADLPPRVPLLPLQATEPGLEDAARPGHFAGVCQVVARLFDMSRPSAALFGEKDWQQFRVIAAMARQEGTPVEIVGAPTVREPGGLAMSSRNIFLSPGDRVRALSIVRALDAAQGEREPAGAERRAAEVLRAAGISPDYAVVRDADSLSPVGAPPPACPLRVLIAARVGPVRLLDNAAWPGQRPNPEL